MNIIERLNFYSSSICIYHMLYIVLQYYIICINVILDAILDFT